MDLPVLRLPLDYANRLPHRGERMPCVPEKEGKNIKNPRIAKEYPIIYPSSAGGPDIRKAVLFR